MKLNPFWRYFEFAFYSLCTAILLRLFNSTTICNKTLTRMSNCLFSAALSNELLLNFLKTPDNTVDYIDNITDVVKSLNLIYYSGIVKAITFNIS